MCDHQPCNGHSPNGLSVHESKPRRNSPFFIGVAGGTASGKTTVCDKIIQRLQDQSVVLLHQDSFYRGLTPEELANVKSYNFDVPDAFDRRAMQECLMDLKAGRGVDVPTYDFTQHRRSKETRRVEPADVVIVEGILVLAMEEVRDMLSMRIYVDTDDDVRLARRIQRDVQCRGRDVASVIEQYTRFVKPAFDQFVAPSRRYADVIIPWQSGHNIVAIDLITEHIRTKLQQHHLRRIYPNLEFTPSSYQIRGMHTIIRDSTSSKNDFVFYADRLNRLVVEAGLGHLPFAEKSVVTPTGHTYTGVEFARKLCGVSVIRSGESMEAALRTCCKGVKIGKILVTRRHESGVGNGPSSGGARAEGNGVSARPDSACSASGRDDIVYERLPADIAERHVLLMDPVLSTGHTLARAIEVLLSKGCDEEKIFVLTLIAAPEGVHRICAAFPRIKVVTSEIDDHVNEHFQVVPGCGEFGDRYFCD